MTWSQCTIVPGVRTHGRRGRRKLDQLSIRLVLDQSVDIPITGIVPNTLGLQFKGIKMRRTFIVGVGMCAAIATAANVSANETYPKIGCGWAIGTG